jgi:hypothetical protein
LLLNGKVLVAGGDGTSSVQASAELYDPISGTWTLTGSMNSVRELHTATLLSNGKVLVAGGDRGVTPLASAEIYDPATGKWTTTGVLNTARNQHTATLLPNGNVLVAGGMGGQILSSAEFYNPITGHWTVTGTMNTNRSAHTMTLLSNGKVLVTGGLGNSVNYISSSELYDPASGIWTLTGSMNSGRNSHTATLLPSGKVMVAGGQSAPFSSELYDVGLGYSNSWQPQISAITTPLTLNNSLVITGSQFRGVSEGSGGDMQNSPADHPLVQLRSIESGQTVFLSSTHWATNSFTSLPVWNFPPGYALATVFVNGIQSTSSIVNVSVPIPTVTTLTGAQMTNGLFQFAFTNSVGALFGVLTTTNLSLPLTNWTALGGVTEVLPGQFQFADPQATNGGQRFYKIYSP